MIEIDCSYSESFKIFIFSFLAEQTFIILDKDLVEGEVICGDPHVEGQFLVLYSS